MRHKRAYHANAYSSYFGYDAVTINPGLSLFGPVIEPFFT